MLYYKVGGEEMNEQYNIEQMLLDQMSVPMKLLTDYKKIGLHEYDVMVVLQIHRYLQKDEEFPTPSELASCLTISVEQCMEIIRKLMQRNLLTIVQKENELGQLTEAYSLLLLWKKLYTETKQEENEEGTIFILFEQEFGRPLSPFEIETISVWLDEDKMKPSLIKAALREAVLMSKLNFKYIDRILREWKRKGIRSVEQARTEGEKFRSNQVTKHYEAEKRDTSIYFNWLEGDD